jgi:hypothetical protein
MVSIREFEEDVMRSILKMHQIELPNKSGVTE